ncbi:MAG: hypothetical protein K8W52_18930, partial [Deltaproteobacteria bacterium]|nr:hypothetical protein [Deltaproteobacteria bacterium]
PPPPPPPPADTVPTPRVDPSEALAHATTRPAPLRAAEAESDPTVIEAPRASGTPIARRHGLLSDLRYAFTARVDLARARRELGEVETLLTGLRRDRDTALVAIASAAIADDGIEHPALPGARDQLASFEDERAVAAGAVAAVESEVAAERGRRERQGTAHKADLEAARADLTRLAAELAPLEREAADVRRQAAEVDATIAGLAKKIAAAEASLVAVKGKRGDPAEVAAELATLRADREVVAREQPGLRARLDGLVPRIAALVAERDRATARIARTETAEADDIRRSDEVQAALAARKVVVDRALRDAIGHRDRALASLGARLAADQPRGLSGERTAAVTAADRRIAAADARAAELREVAASIDRRARARGTAVAIGLVVLLAAAIWLVLR